MAVMTKTPLFSIIVPLYNKEHYLEDCLESIENQTEQHWECVIINDGSTDNSEKIARKFEKKDPRFRVFNQKNSGPSVARNYGIKESRGELLHFLDADDYYPSLDTLSLIGSIYTNEKPKPMAISGNILIFNSNDGSVRSDIEVNTTSNKNRYQSFDELQNDYFFTRFFFNRKFIIDHNVSFPEYTYVGEDPVFLVKALSQMKRFLVTSVPVYMYRQVAGSGSELSHYNEAKLISYMTTQLEILEICQEKQYHLLKKRLLDRIDHETLDLYMKYKDSKTEIDSGLKKILAFIDAEIHHVRIVNTREAQARIHSLELSVLDLKEQLEVSRKPGIKTATRSLLGAFKRKAAKTYKTLSKRV